MNCNLNILWNSCVSATLKEINMTSIVESLTWKPTKSCDHVVIDSCAKSCTQHSRKEGMKKVHETSTKIC